jgi:hypothetical protein
MLDDDIALVLLEYTGAGLAGEARTATPSWEVGDVANPGVRDA